MHKILFPGLALAMLLWGCDGEDGATGPADEESSSSSDTVLSSSSAESSSSEEVSSSSAELSSSSEAESSSSSSPSSSSAVSSSSAELSSSSEAEPSSSSSLSSSSVSSISYGILTDSRDDKTYKTVEIGTQTWMAENLNYETASGSRCYNDFDSHCETYGRLYNLTAAQTACPEGWHLPSDDEWTTLTDLVGSSAGTKLKTVSGWDYDGNGTDEYGFSALPGGYRNSGGVFHDVGDSGYWWTATEDSSTDAYYRDMRYYSVYVYGGIDDKEESHSVRCLKD